MSQATAKRRRRQMSMNNAHLSGMGVSRYRRPNLVSVGQAIEQERRRAAAEQARRAKAKK